LYPAALQGYQQSWQAFLAGERLQGAWLAKRCQRWACPARRLSAFLAELFQEALLARRRRWRFLVLRMQQTFVTERAVNIQDAPRVLFGNNPTPELDHSS
jgi:hypothetical protein